MKRKESKFGVVTVLQIITLAALLIFMEYSVTTGKISKVFLAAPSGILKELVRTVTNGIISEHLLITLKEVITGYLIGGVVGVSVGLLWTLFKPLEKYMNVFCSAIMAVPKTAILPLLILWFGIGFKSKVFLIFLSSVFQILYNTVTGTKQCPNEYLKVARVFELNKFETVFKVLVPAALPSMFNGFRMAAATAMTTVVFAEMQSAKAGLGFLLAESQQLLNTPRIFLVIVIVTVISVLLVKLVALIEYAFTHRWLRK
ncbi:MAG: ABC transporter permease [Lachnospiraceae bacterium]|nr:ABC transporter permease [Lachnospiraceae bacterium]